MELVSNNPENHFKAESGSVIVPIDRLPSNIGKMLKMYLSGELLSLHIIGATSNNKVISVSAGAIPDLIKQHDTF